MYSKFVAELSGDQIELRNKLKGILISSELNISQVANDMKISGHTLNKFLRGNNIYPRTAWRIAAYIEMEMQKS